MKHNSSLVVQTIYPVDRFRLWSYLTELTHLQKWFFKEIKTFQPIKGFKTQFSIEHNAKIFTHLWTIRHIIPQKKLVLGWQYQEYKGDSETVFALSDCENGTMLTLSAYILDPFPALEEFSQKSMKNGWTTLLKNQLKPYVNETIRS